MPDTQSKIMSSSSPNFVTTGSKHAVTRTYPKNGQEQSASLNQGPFMEHPRGKANTITAPKSGAKQHI